MVWSITRWSLTELVRDRRLWILGAVLLALAAVSLVSGAAEQRAHEADRAAAAAADRQAWLHQGEVNPHSAAHFGMYAFKPRGALAAFDSGLSSWLGEAIWIEGHYQNPPQARPGDADPLSQRFGDLSPAWMLQVLGPLLLILVGFSTIAGERERGSLRLQLTQGATALRLIAGRAIALWLIGALLTVLTLAATGAGVVLGGSLTTDTLVRLLAAGAGLLLYFALWAAIVVAVSAGSGAARRALVILLAVWATAVVLVPRFAAEQAALSAPTPDAGAFWARASEMSRDGMDGDDPAEARTERLRTATLARYGVTDMADLPINFGGISLQAGEEYGNAVFDRLYGEIAANEDRQRAIQRLFAVASPLIPARNLSMGAAGTDLEHHRNYVAAAESYRRDLQRRLNADYTQRDPEGRTHGAAYRDTISPLDYRPPTYGRLASTYGIDALILCLWLLAATGACVVAARRLEVRA